MLMIDSAEFQAKELCRLTNIPFYLAGVNIGSYQYTTSRGAREDLYLFGARQYLDCVSQTLSMNNILFYLNGLNKVHTKILKIELSEI